MTHSNFEFLKLSFPEIYKLGRLTEGRIGKDYGTAMAHIQQIATTILEKIVTDVGVVPGNMHVDGVVHFLFQNKLISEEMYRIVREVELFDSRESQVFLEPDKVEYLFGKIYDFAVWFYTNYEDHAFVPAPFLSPTKKSFPISAQKEREHQASASLSVDGIARAAEWVGSLEALERYTCMNYENGESYHGQMLKGLKHGQGVYTWQDGTVYIGYWHHDQEHGYGEKLYSNGDVYRGYWRYGAFDNQGVYCWQDGHKYEGQWQDGFEHGFGTKTTANGATIKGFWIFGEFAQAAD